MKVKEFEYEPIICCPHFEKQLNEWMDGKNIRIQNVVTYEIRGKARILVFYEEESEVSSYEESDFVDSDIVFDDANGGGMCKGRKQVGAVW